jgi:hypothetical protein
MLYESPPLEPTGFAALYPSFTLAWVGRSDGIAIG